MEKKNLEMSDLNCGANVRDRAMKKFENKETLYLRDTSQDVTECGIDALIRTLCYYEKPGSTTRGKYHMVNARLTRGPSFTDDFLLSIIRGDHIAYGLDVVDIYGATNK